MSTTFEVIPVLQSNITFKQVIELSEQRINEFLGNIDKSLRISLRANLHENFEKYVKEIDPRSNFYWEENEYVWFTVKGIGGGTDAYCEEIKDNEIDPQNPWWRFDDMKSNNKTIKEFDNKISKSKLLNRYWRFRRSAGQPAIINLSYGLISAAIAELTEGFIWTDDGAWDHKKFPAEAEEFYKWYFNPEIEDDEDCADWAKRCIALLKEEIIAADNI